MSGNQQSIKNLETSLSIARGRGPELHDAVISQSQSLEAAVVTLLDGQSYHCALLDEEQNATATVYERVLPMFPGNSYVVGDYVVLVFRLNNKQPAILAGAGSSGSANGAQVAAFVTFFSSGS